MSYLNSFQRLRAATLLLGLLLLAALLSGCDGGSAVTSSVYAGKSVSATKMTLNALTADLQVKTAAVGSAATGSLTLTDPTRAIVGHSRLIIATPNCNGTYDPKTGALNLTGSYEYPAGTTHNFSITGTLPVPPSNKGSLNITLDGTVYGPFLFGDNTSTGSTGTTGNTGTTGSTGTTGPDSLTVSGAVGTTDLKNGLISSPFTAVKVASPFTIFGVSYEGEYGVVTKTGYPDLRLTLYGLGLVVGKTFDIAKQTGSMLATESSGALYIADSGTVTATAVSATSLTVNFTNVHFKPVPNGLTPATNQFTLNGSITAPIIQ